MKISKKNQRHSYKIKFCCISPICLYEIW